MTLDIRHNVPLAPLTTFNIGGPARYFTYVRTENDMREAVLWAKQKSIDFVILSGGSNVLIPDEGLNKLVIHVIKGDFSIREQSLTADAGCNLLKLIRAASENNLGGWEKLAGIPGTIGGAIRGNAGAFGTEIKDLPVKVRALNYKTSEIKEFQNADCGFAYRRSFFKDNPEWIITNLAVRLLKVAEVESIRLIEYTIAEREQRHLQNIQAAGSYFMNPIVPPVIQELFENDKGLKSKENRVPAGWLIERAGMKGVKVGDAISSIQHPNYLVNDGNATAKDVKQLAQSIKDAVHAKFGVNLCEEAVILS
ncbi:MAG: UDP-N-acetylmuramate dehydrogenase [bacterium]|nr:UDP-N-acetylmuramate dehydrogenase [bacterium]